MSEINIATRVIETQYHKTKIGELILGTHEDKLCLLDFRFRRMRTSVDKRLKQCSGAEFIEDDNSLLQKTKKQIEEYLTGERKEFELPLKTFGTDLQQKVWAALLEVKYGETATYLDLAKIIGNEKAVRAVASANGANALALILPCHRIIGSNGDLTGYGGGLAIKKRLLKMEKERTLLNDEQRFAFIGSKDKKYDHRFITAVKTKGIYCLPSCSARKPNRENVVFYEKRKDAVKNGFRACKVCKS